MLDFYRSQEQQAPPPSIPPKPSVNIVQLDLHQNNEEEPKEPSMLCNESLQIPKAFPFGSESSFTKAPGFFDQPKHIPVIVGSPTSYQPGPIKIPTSRYMVSPEIQGPPHIMRRPEHHPVYETPTKRLKRRIVAPQPQIEHSMSKRGLTIMDPYTVIMDEMAVLHNPEYSHTEKFQSATNVSEKVKKWIKYEYFYSGIDKPYFEKNELNECLTSLGIPYKSMQRGDFVLIRKAIGKPRRLSSRFLNEERAKLQKYREISREIIPIIVFFIKL